MNMMAKEESKMENLKEMKIKNIKDKYARMMRRKEEIVREVWWLEAEMEMIRKKHSNEITESEFEML